MLSGDGEGLLRRFVEVVGPRLPFLGVDEGSEFLAGGGGVEGSAAWNTDVRSFLGEGEAEAAAGAGHDGVGVVQWDGMEMENG